MSLRVRLPLLGLLALLLTAAPARAGLKIYFLRHAQGGHNVVKEWTGKPRSEWPAYVGNEDMLTPKGQTQAAVEVPAKLAALRFDLIACSPLPRTRETIRPYLQSAGLRAELWPELEEFNYQPPVPPLPVPAPDILNGGPRIELPDAEKSSFILRAAALNRIKISKDKKQAAADIEALVNGTIAMIRSRFGGSDRSILLVGHGGNGSVLLKKLVRDTGLDWPKNAALWMVEEQTDGRFLLMMANDAAPARP